MPLALQVMGHSEMSVLLQAWSVTTIHFKPCLSRQTFVAPLILCVCTLGSLCREKKRKFTSMKRMAQ